MNLDSPTKLLNQLLGVPPGISLTTGLDDHAGILNVSSDGICMNEAPYRSGVGDEARNMNEATESVAGDLLLRVVLPCDSLEVLLTKAGLIVEVEDDAPLSRCQ